MTTVQRGRHPLIAGVLLYPQTLSRPANADPRKKASANGRAKRADAKQAKKQQRITRSRRAKSIAGQEHRSGRQHPEQFGPIQRVFAEYLQHIRKKCDAGTEQQEPDRVESMYLALTARGAAA